MSHNLGEFLHISNIISSTKINNSFDACSFILVSQNGIAKEEQRREREMGQRGKGRRREGDLSSDNIDCYVCSKKRYIRNK